ncbi:hypothetical protein ACFFLM_04460 [Deinococcus oregonensis]|uniref:Uncharacterized protein n=1 Tax=Deinococcus oregonensis TaxID=1805970 RepID=A0ABV6AX13_9DEIO
MSELEDLKVALEAIVPEEGKYNQRFSRFLNDMNAEAQRQSTELKGAATALVNIDSDASEIGWGGTFTVQLHRSSISNMELKAPLHIFQITADTYEIQIGTVAKIQANSGAQAMRQLLAWATNDAEEEAAALRGGKPTEKRQLN